MSFGMDLCNSVQILPGKSETGSEMHSRMHTEYIMHAHFINVNVYCTFRVTENTLTDIAENAPLGMQNNNTYIV